MIKSMHCSSRRHGFGSQNPYQAPEPPISPIPGDPASSFGLFRHLHIPGVHPCTRAHIHPHKINSNCFSFSSERNPKASTVLHNYEASSNLRLALLLRSLCNKKKLFSKLICYGSHGGALCCKKVNRKYLSFDCFQAL